MKTGKVVQAVIVAVLTAAVAAPALSAEGNLVDLKKVEARIVAAQNQVVGGKLDEGLAALQEARAQAVTADLAARAEFVGKLAEVRMAERLGDQARLLTALNDAFKQAKEPDQIEAVWRTGLAVAKAALAGPGNAAPVIDLLAKGPGPAMKQFAANVELARLRIATGNVGAAEAELRNAAQRATSERDWSQWATVVNQLAVAVDGGQSPQAGADVFDRLRQVAAPAVATVDVTKGRFLLRRGQLDAVEALADQAISAATSEAQIHAALSLQYDLALALAKAGQSERSEAVLENAECLAAARSASAALATMRGKALTALGKPERAADVFWAASQAVKAPKEQEQMLTSFGAALVAAGDSAGMVARLQAAEAEPVVYVAVAGAMVRVGDSAGALELVGSVPARAFVENPQSVTGLAPLMKQIQTQRQQIAKDQGARVRAIASAFEAAAKKTEDPKASAELAKQAAALTALATQVEK